jgi:polysaccharide biosynthesis/export protein
LLVSFVDLAVGGVTALEAEERLREALAPYIKQPRVQVVFQQKVVADRVFVFGEVNAPGVYPLSPGMTVMDALGQANGYTDDAYLPSARVLRGGLAEPQILATQLDRLLYEGDLGQNLLLKDQDIVYVPRSRVGDWNQFIEEIRPTLEVITLPLQSVILGRAIRR